MDCARLGEISQSFLCENSRLRIFVRGLNAKKRRFFFLGLIYILGFGAVSYRNHIVPGQVYQYLVHILSPVADNCSS